MKLVESHHLEILYSNKKKKKTHHGLNILQGEP